MMVLLCLLMMSPSQYYDNDHTLSDVRQSRTDDCALVPSDDALLFSDDAGSLSNDAFASSLTVSIRSVQIGCSR